MNDVLTNGRHDVNVNGARLAYHVQGEGRCRGPPGGPGFSHTYMRTPLLEEKAKVLYVNPIGCGDSARLDNPPNTGARATWPISKSSASTSVSTGSPSSATRPEDFSRNSTRSNIPRTSSEWSRRYEPDQWPRVRRVPRQRDEGALRKGMVSYRGRGASGSLHAQSHAG